MKASRYTTDEVGGAFSIPTVPVHAPQPSYADGQEDEADEIDDETGLYVPPIARPVSKRPIPKSATAINQQLKAKRIAEARLARISEELSQLADTIRYLNPLVAEAIDDAWDANETAIEMLSNQAIW